MLLSYYAARANLYALWHHHPEWSHAQLAAALGASKGWVKKWLSRFREEEAQGIPLQHILQGHSRARKQLPDKIHPLMVESILSIRDRPPEGLRRVPGQEAIQYYLKRDPALQLFHLPIPSCKTIYRVLKNADRIASPSHRVPEPVERPAPLTCWQIDFKDVSSVTADPRFANGNIWWKPSTSSIWEPPCFWRPMCALILRPKPPCKPSAAPLRPLAALRRSPWIAIRAG